MEDQDLFKLRQFAFRDHFDEKKIPLDLRDHLQDSAQNHAFRVELVQTRGDDNITGTDVFVSGYIFNLAFSFSGDTGQNPPDPGSLTKTIHGKTRVV